MESWQAFGVGDLRMSIRWRGAVLYNYVLGALFTAGELVRESGPGVWALTGAFRIG